MCDIGQQDAVLEVLLLLLTLSTTLQTSRLCCDITWLLPARMLLRVLRALLRVLRAFPLLSHLPFAASFLFPCLFPLGPPSLLPFRMSLQTLSIWLSRCRMTPQGLTPSFWLPRDLSQLLGPYRVNIRGLSQPLCLLVCPVQRLLQGSSTTAAHPPPLSGPLHRCAHQTFLPYRTHFTVRLVADTVLHVLPAGRYFSMCKCSHSSSSSVVTARKTEEQEQIRKMRSPQDVPQPACMCLQYVLQHLCHNMHDYRKSAACSTKHIPILRSYKRGMLLLKEHTVAMPLTRCNGLCPSHG